MVFMKEPAVIKVEFGFFSIFLRLVVIHIINGFFSSLENSHEPILAA
jgi:hypothetical protein